MKGCISYNKYIWHSENSEDTCDVCKYLDGKEFDFYEEVPERPHPNCRCTVEIVEDTSSNGDFERAKEENDDTNKISSENQNPQTSTPQPTSNAQQQNSAPKKTTQPQRWIKPCDGPITSQYGWRTHPVYGTKKFHDGIDIGVPLNTPVHAPADGIIKVAQWYNGYGNNITRKIFHNLYYTTIIFVDRHLFIIFIYLKMVKVELLSKLTKNSTVSIFQKGLFLFAQREFWCKRDKILYKLYQINSLKSAKASTVRQFGIKKEANTSL